MSDPAANDAEQPQQQPQLPQPQPQQYAPHPQYTQPVYTQPQYQQQPYPQQTPAAGATFGSPATESGPRPGRGIAIAAMATGLAAVVTVLVGALYFPLALVLGAAAGLVAVVLAIIALIKRSAPGPAATGLAAGALSLVTVIAFTLGTIGIQALTEATMPPGSAHGGNGGSDSGEGLQGTGSISWPANLASGGIMFTGSPAASNGGPGVDIGPGGVIMKVVESKPLPNDSFPNLEALPAADDGTQPDRIQVYLDYRCPACLTFEETNGATLEQAAGAGAVVELQSLTFLDHAAGGSFYSSRVAGAMACMAENQPDDAWAAHRSLLQADFQPTSGGSDPSDVDIVERLDDATGGLNDKARSCVADGQHVTFAQALSNWITTNPVPRANDPDLMVTGTPLVVVNGEPFTGAIDDAFAFSAFLAEQGVPLP